MIMMQKYVIYITTASIPHYYRKIFTGKETIRAIDVYTCTYILVDR